MIHSRIVTLVENGCPPEFVELVCALVAAGERLGYYGEHATNSEYACLHAVLAKCASELRTVVDSGKPAKERYHYLQCLECSNSEKGVIAISLGDTSLLEFVAAHRDHALELVNRQEPSM